MKLTKTALFENYKKMWPFIKPYKWLAIISVVLSIPVGALEAGVALLLKPFMDTVLIEKSISASYIPLIIIGITALQSILMFTANMLNAYVSQKLSLDIKNKMFKKLLYKDPEFFDNTSSGNVLFDFGGNVDTACAGLLKNVKDFTTRVFSSFFLICVLLWNSWRLSIIALIVLLISVLPLNKIRKKIAKITKSLLEQVGFIATFYNEIFKGHKVISTYNMQDTVYNEFKDSMDRIFKLQFKTAKKTGFISPIMNIIVAIGIAGVIWYGGSLIEQKIITPGNFVSFTVSLMMLYTPIKKVGGLLSNIQIALTSMDRLFKTFEAPATIQEKKNAKELKEIKKGIFFEHVNFSYNNKTPVLKDINLDITLGKTFAFVGNSGGGKTTLVNLIPRFYDIQSGSLKIDDTDVRDLTLKSLRSHISIVFQDNFLFAGTLRKNLLVGNKKATEKELRTAIKSACLEDFVSKLPNGLDTEIGEMGSLLSGGQKQRIAIARAFLKDSPIVILDEATSALDNKSEKVVQDAINNLMENRTVLIIAHRLSTVKNADKIIVLDHGEIVEQGKHDYLIKKDKGVYKSLYKTQLN